MTLGLKSRFERPKDPQERETFRAYFQTEMLEPSNYTAEYYPMLPHIAPLFAARAANIPCFNGAKLCFSVFSLSFFR